MLDGTRTYEHPDGFFSEPTWYYGFNSEGDGGVVEILMAYATWYQVGKDGGR